MTAKTTISLLDSALTPESPGTPAAATRIFTPGALENGYIHTFYEGTSGTTPATRSKLTLSLSPATATKPSRTKGQLMIPKAKIVDGVVEVAHVNRGFVETVFDKDATRDDRRDMTTLLYSLIASAEFGGMSRDQEDLY